MDIDAKLRPLYLLQILKERTDEDNYLTTSQLCDILKRAYGMETHRTTIKGDIEILQKAGKILFRIQGKALLHQLLVIFPQGGKADIGYLRRGIRAVGIDAQDTIFCPDKVQRLGICLLLCGNGIGNRYGIRTEGKLLVYQKGKQRDAAQR